MLVSFACSKGEAVVDSVEENIYTSAIKMMHNSDEYGNQPLVLCHFSDIHGSEENCKRVLEFVDPYLDYLDDVICSGDMVSYNFTNDFSYWEKSGAQQVLFCIGNHDSSNENYQWDAIPDTLCFKRYIEPFIKYWNVVHHDRKCYFYKEYPNKQICLIFVDALHFDEQQEKWLEGVLDNCLVPNYSVICVGHYPPGEINHFDVCFDARKGDSYWLTDDGSLSTMIREYGYKVTPIIDHFISKGGNFITWLVGHTHKDIFGVVNDYPNQLCIGVAEALWRDGYTGYYGDNIREYGSKSQDLFNIISVNHREKIIRLLRVGADETTDGRQRLKMCWDYKNNKEVNW